MIKLPKPPGNENGTRHIAESHRLVRERTFPIHNNLLDILEALKSSHSTGQLLIDMNQGGIGSIRFREEQKVKFDEK